MKSSLVQHVQEAGANAQNQFPKSAQNDLEKVVPPNVSIYVLVACGVAAGIILIAVLVGIATDLVLKRSSSESTQETPGDQKECKEESEAGPSLEERDVESFARGSSYFFDKDTGVWSVKGFLDQGPASSIGLPLYHDIEQGLSASSAGALPESTLEQDISHVDLSALHEV